jgi:hypothetical protein
VRIDFLKLVFGESTPSILPAPSSNQSRDLPDRESDLLEKSDHGKSLQDIGTVVASPTLAGL